MFKKGEFNPWSMMLIALVAVSTVAIVGILSSPPSLEWALSKVSSSGYVVFAAGEYADIMSALSNISTRADAAAVNASVAAGLSQATLNTLKLHTENEVYLYPNMSTTNVTFTAGGGVDTYGNWAEINSSTGITLSSVFAAHAGYLSEIMTHNYNAADKVYIIEIAYGGDKTIVGRVKIRSDWTYVLDLNSVVIPLGETVYYRMQCETAGATLLADFRYYYN